MGAVKSRWIRWGVPLALAVLAVWLVSQRASKKKSEAPLPRPILAEGPPGFRQSKTESNLSPQYVASIWPAGHRDSSNTDFVPLELGASFELEKHLLQGHPIFWPPTVGLRRGWMNVVCGYHLPKFLSRSDRTRVPIPQESLFVTFDLATGDPGADPMVLPETSEGFVTPLPNGKVMITTSGAITSIFYYMVNRILPKRLQVAGPPNAGLLLLRPR